MAQGFFAGQMCKSLSLVADCRSARCRTRSEWSLEWSWLSSSSGTYPDNFAVFFLIPQISVYEFSVISFSAYVTVLEAFLGGRLSVVMATIDGHGSFSFCSANVPVILEKKFLIVVVRHTGKSLIIDILILNQNVPVVDRATVAVLRARTLNNLALLY